jgi:hypothetical protein
MMSKYNLLVQKSEPTGIYSRLRRIVHLLLGDKFIPVKWEILFVDLDEVEVSRTLEHCIAMNDYIVCLLGDDFYTRFKIEIVE